MRVLIVDDHAGFRRSARSLLETAGHVVVGEAGDAASGVALAGELQPDVVLLDVQLPDHDGFWAAGELDAAHNPAQVVLISSREASDYGSRLDEVVARGFIPKSELSVVAVERLVATSS